MFCHFPIWGFKIMTQIFVPDSVHLSVEWPCLVGNLPAPHLTFHSILLLLLLQYSIANNRPNNRKEKEKEKLDRQKINWTTSKNIRQCQIGQISFLPSKGFLFLQSKCFCDETLLKRLNNICWLVWSSSLINQCTNQSRHCCWPIYPKLGQN